MYIDDTGKVTISSLQSLEPTKDNKDPFNLGEKLSMVLGYASCHETSITYTVKLYNVKKIQYSNGALTKFNYRSSNSFLSSKYDSDINNLLFNRLMLNSEAICDWLPTTGFNSASIDIDSYNYRASQTYTQPKKIPLFKNDDYNIYIYFRASFGQKGRRTSYIKEEIFLNIETEKQFHPKELYKIKAIIERLFSIILCQPFVSTITELQTTSGCIYRDLNKKTEISSGQGFPIDFETFQQNSQSIFKYWFEKQERFELFIKNFFSVYGQDGVLVENKFLTYISILENYHKNNIKNNATLKQKLLFVIENSCFKEAIVDIEKYSEKLKITRNYHAHLEETHEEKALNVEAIDQSNMLLEIIIREIMLKELELINAANPHGIVELSTKINKILE